MALSEKTQNRSLLRKTPELDDQEFLTLRQAAQVIPSRPSVATIYRWVSSQSGKNQCRLPSIRIGGRRMIRRSDLEAFLASLNEIPSEPSQMVEASPSLVGVLLGVEKPAPRTTHSDEKETPRLMTKNNSIGISEQK